MPAATLDANVVTAEPGGGAGPWRGPHRWWEWLWRAIALLAVVVGVAWRVSQYTLMASLGVDEIALARNVLDRDVVGLFQWLEYGQVAPLGFLLAVKASVWLFGSSEWSFRLVPFVCGIVSLPVFYVVARRMVNESAACAATTLLALATPFALWSVMLKQYSSDVLCCIVVIGLAHQVLSRTRLSRQDVAKAAAGGACAGFCSHAALLVLAASGAVLLADALHRRDRSLLTRGAIVATWGLTVVTLLAWTRHLQRPAYSSYARRFWEPLFMPLDPGAAIAWVWDTMLVTFYQTPWPSGGLAYERAKVWVLLLFCGVVAIFKDRPRLGFLLIGPAAVTLAASAMREYPFGGRVGLFLLPFFLLFVVLGAQKIGSLAGRAAAALAPLVVVPFAVQALMQVSPTFKPEHMRPELEYLSARLQPGDTIWVYYGAGQAFKYYATRIPMPAAVVFGECDRTDPRANFRQLDAVRGRSRVWVVLSHIVETERRNLLHYLDAIGTLQAMHSSDVPERSITTSSVYLYRLDDAAQLSRASASQFPATPIDEPSPWSCYGTMSPLPGSERKAVAALEQ